MSDVAVLLAWAAHFAHVPMPATVPEVRAEPASYFQYEGVAGTLADGVIHVRHADDECFIVHELTHYLLPPDMPVCQQERIAYRVQIEWALENGVFGCRPRTSEHEACL